MKLKGIHPLEQNADKIVLGAVGAALLGAVALQVLQPGNKIKVGTADNIAPGDAYVPVKAAAEQLVRGMEQSSPKLPNAPSLNLAGRLAIGSDIKPREGVRVALGKAPGIGAADTVRAGVGGMYALPAIPAPTPAKANAFSTAIHPIEVIRTKELAALLPPAQPFDKAAVSIEVGFDGVALRAALEKDPDGASGPMIPLEASWWRDSIGTTGESIAIVALEVERELVRNADGSSPSGETKTLVKSIPGRVDTLVDWNTNVRSLGDVAPMLTFLRENSEDVLRPAYLESIAGLEWIPPSEVEQLGTKSEKDQKTRRFQIRLNQLTREIETIEERLKNAGGSDPRDRENPRGNEGPGRSGKGGPGSGAPPRTDKPDPKAGGNKTILEGQLKKKRAELERVQAELRALGVNVDSSRDASQPAEGAKARAGMLEDKELRLWAHDLTAVPGALYRYRARVVINNPAYGRSVAESQKEIAASSLIRGAWSEWSAEVEVDRPEYVFVTSAEQRGDFSPRPRAGAEVAQFFYGFYRSATVSLEPGDTITGEAKLPPLKLVDMAKLEQVSRTGDAAGEVPPPPVRREEEQPLPGGKRPFGEAPTPTAVPGSPDASAGPDWLIALPKKELPLSVDAMLLDVTSGPGAEGRERFLAVFRSPDGVLVVKSPDNDRATAAYAKVKASVTAGLNQGAEPNPIDEAKPFVPKQREKPTEDKKTGGGGG